MGHRAFGSGTFPVQAGHQAQIAVRRPLTAKEHAFITARGGFLALETIHDTVTAASAAELEEYLNSG